MMEHFTVFKYGKEYASFPLLKKLEDRILIGYFTAPIPDHMGIFWWNIGESFNQGETWEWTRKGESFREEYDWPAHSPRERSDRFTIERDHIKIMTGSYGFKIEKDRFKGNVIRSSRNLFHETSSDNWKTMRQKHYVVPGVKAILTFPRSLQVEDLILVPAYALFYKSDESRCLVWRSEDQGKTFRLWNMFPDGINGNEMAFVSTSSGILAHIRSDKHPFLMESWSEDNGKTWAYPTNVCGEGQKSVVGGPPHLLRLKDGRILCSYGYRKEIGSMGIRAIISEDEGETWLSPVSLRQDGGYLSSLRKKSWFKKSVWPGNDVGYPVSIQIEDGKVLTAYYITCEDRVTHIAVTRWKP